MPDLQISQENFGKAFVISEISSENFLERALGPQALKEFDLPLQCQSRPAAIRRQSTAADAVFMP